MAKAKATEPTETELTGEVLQRLAGHVAQRIEAEKTDFLVEAENILRQVVEEDRALTFDERKKLWQTMRWDDGELSRQRRRMFNVVQFQAVAGTSQDRERLQAESEQSAKDLQEHGQRLREEIAQREAQLKSLESAASKSSKRVEQANEALEKLATLIPTYLSEEVNLRKRHAGSQFGKRFAELTNELSYRDQVSGGPNGSGYSADTWHMHLRMVDPALLGRDQYGNTQVDQRRFAELKTRWNEERPALEQEASKLRSELESAEASREALRKFYWR